MGVGISVSLLNLRKGGRAGSNMLKQLLQLGGPLEGLVVGELLPKAVEDARSVGGAEEETHDGLQALQKSGTVVALDFLQMRFDAV